LALVAVAVLGLASTLVATRIVPLRGDTMRVTIVVGGVTRSARVDKPATVGAALKAGHVVPRPGGLLSLVTKKLLDPAHTPAQLLVNGVPSTAGSPVPAGATIGVVESADMTEDTVESGDIIPAPAEPDVIKGLWHPGQPGKAINRKGAVSGEVVATKELQAAVPPAPVTEKLVALTFDDGPWATTPDVLRVLREKNVKALFCVVTRLLKGEGLAYTKGAIGEGHQICNHTVDHDQALPRKPQNVIDDEIRGGNRQLVERLGFKPTYYRPPGGALGPNVEATAKAESQQVLLWTVDTKDYTKPPPAAIVGAVMGNIKPGGVILMHDGGGDRSATVAALPILIDQLRAAGYELVLPDAIPPVPAAPLVPGTLPAA